MLRKALWIVVALGCLSIPPTLARGAPVADLESTLAEMHPDYRRFIRDVRPFPPGTQPANIYMGLVRPGGADPRMRRDAPQPGATRRYDLLVATGDLVPPAWSKLLLDHEYFHARHLARGSRLPFPSFASAAANRHFHEALAWGHNLARDRAGAYGRLPDLRRAEAEERYRSHRDALREYVRRRQPAVWAYYAQFLPEVPGAVRLSSATR